MLPGISMERLRGYSHGKEILEKGGCEGEWIVSEVHCVQAFL